MTAYYDCCTAKPARNKDQYPAGRPYLNSVSSPVSRVYHQLLWVMAALLLACLMSTATAMSEPENPRVLPSEGGEKPLVREAIFAGGCFWCMEPPFDKLEGVIDTSSGYAGGKSKNPSYKEVSTGNSGHIEVLRVRYDPQKVSYDTLLKVFWRNIDPFDASGQFCDKGEQYTSAIFTSDPDERKKAEASKAALETRFDKSIATRIRPSAKFYPAESYHQDYYKKNPVRYKYYRWGCGRDKRLEKVWGDEAGGKHLSK